MGSLFLPDGVWSGMPLLAYVPSSVSCREVICCSVISSKHYFNQEGGSDGIHSVVFVDSGKKLYWTRSNAVVWLKTMVMADI